jgi:hypothetical protein
LPNDGIRSEEAEPGVAWEPFNFGEQLVKFRERDILRSFAFGSHVCLDAERARRVSSAI